MALSDQTDLEKFLQIVFGTNPEPVVTYLIEGADSLIRDYIGFDPEQADGLAEVHDPTYTPNLWVRRPPIRDVTSITADGVTVDSSLYTFYLMDEDKSGLIRYLNGNRWASEPRGITVTYDAGYLPADLPKTIRDASVRIVARAFQKGVAFAQDGSGATTGLRSIALAGSDSITWAEGSEDVALKALELTFGESRPLSQYKRGWVV